MDYTVTLQADKRMLSGVGRKPIHQEGSIGITACQFGEEPAPEGSYKLYTSNVAANNEDTDVFAFDMPQSIPEGAHVRFNLAIQIDINNAVNVQIRINPDKTIEWRWLAYIGASSDWSENNTDASWQDNGHEYLIYMVNQQNEKNFWIYVGRVPMVYNLPPAFFPPDSLIPKPLQPTVEIGGRKFKLPRTLFDN
ncbi:hypothetical protein MSP8887_01109 [Marinomonas spartinae]|uniref:Uncharacterized protein n=1 Tax=Marinomonas spartinae TaxID=1792290 RepID=A0A1A8TUM3_9GAMM|nr:hypothetical protein [Marinomonas spartinae]SBS29572.1 hypothetical protein MSP8887_01109 [Marinomonas spartinae]SBS36942.1 hypothetical protein MSP8886_03910 [Marinomonas spartinae]